MVSSSSATSMLTSFVVGVSVSLLLLSSGYAAEEAKSADKSVFELVMPADQAGAAASAKIPATASEVVILYHLRFTPTMQTSLQTLVDQALAKPAITSIRIHLMVCDYNGQEDSKAVTNLRDLFSDAKYSKVQVLPFTQGQYYTKMDLLGAGSGDPDSAVALFTPKTTNLDDFGFKAIFKAIKYLISTKDLETAEVIPFKMYQLLLKACAHIFESNEEKMNALFNEAAAQEDWSSNKYKKSKQLASKYSQSLGEEKEKAKDKLDQFIASDDLLTFLSDRTKMVNDEKKAPAIAQRLQEAMATMKLDLLKLEQEFTTATDNDDEQQVKKVPSLASVADSLSDIELITLAFNFKKSALLFKHKAAAKSVPKGLYRNLGKLAESVLAYSLPGSSLDWRVAVQVLFNEMFGSKADPHPSLTTSLEQMNKMWKSAGGMKEVFARHSNIVVFSFLDYEVDDAAVALGLMRVIPKGNLGFIGQLSTGLDPDQKDVSDADHFFQPFFTELFKTKPEQLKPEQIAALNLIISAQPIAGLVFDEGAFNQFKVIESAESLGVSKKAIKAIAV